MRRCIDAADELRAQAVGDTVTYVVNRNINYTNICLYHCGFCAFSKGRGSADLRGPAYNLDLDEIARRAVEAAAAGATEVCLQGGIHPSFTGQTYLDIVRAVKAGGARDARARLLAAGNQAWRHARWGCRWRTTSSACAMRASRHCRAPRPRFSTMKSATSSVPTNCNSEQWLEVIGTAHRGGTAYHRDHHVRPRRAAGALGAPPAATCAACRRAPRGITEFVPLGFVHMEAPLWRKGRTRSGPTLARSRAHARGAADSCCIR